LEILKTLRHAGRLTARRAWPGIIFKTSRSTRFQSRITTAGAAVRLVQKEFAVAGRCFGILINRDDDRLDVLITPTFSGGEIAHFLKRLETGEGSSHLQTISSSLNPIALGAEVFDLVQHPVKQSLG
jgi:hypothetical protein